jgi:signal transduction histidine kinase
MDGRPPRRGGAAHGATGGVAFLAMADELPSPPRVALPERLVDVCLAVGLAIVVLAAEAFGDRPWAETAGEIILGVGGAVALLGRRRWPIAVLAVNAGAVAVEGLLGLRVVSAPTLLVALYTVCARRSRDEGLRAAAIALLALLVQIIRQTESPVGNAVSAAVSVAAATGIGLYMGTRRQYVQALRERALQLGRERALLADSALAEERARIARELHDVVAHHVTLMVVQAGALRESMPADDPGRSMLDSMADTGRQALAEMRRVLDLLRVTDGGERGPQPSVEQIEGLVAQMRSAGLRVELTVDGVPRPVPVAVGVSAYRIVQEALTNVLKHAGAARADVLVRYRPDALELQVTDDGPGTATPPQPGGHGLIGMRERTALFGGSLLAGASPGGGYRLQAVLPTEHGAG